MASLRRPALKLKERLNRDDTQGACLVLDANAGYLIRVVPHPRSYFFEQAILKGEVGDRLLERCHNRQLERDCDHLTFDESGDEAILANQYIFTVAGQRFG